MDPRTIPGAPLVRLYDGGMKETAPRPVLDAYVHWLMENVYYGWQLPLSRVKARARLDSDLKDWDGIERIDTVLIPSRWLWKLWKKESKDYAGIRILDPETRPAILCYLTAIEAGHEYPERDHFSKWLGWMIEEEKEVKKTFVSLLASLNGPEKDVAAELEKLPFAIRVQYGAYLGWNIPTASQWEKACRGADARAYPWGDDQDALNAWLSRKEPWLVDEVRSHLKDRSPHGVFCTAGNLSEWVLVPNDEEHFLKGGNYESSIDYANAAHFFSLASGSHEPWAGVRVVRELVGSPVKKSVEKSEPTAVKSSEFGK